MVEARMSQRHFQHSIKLKVRAFRLSALILSRTYESMVHRFICNLSFQKTRKNIFINSSASFKHGVEINSHWGSAKEDYKSFEIRQIKIFNEVGKTIKILIWEVQVEKHYTNINNLYYITTPWQLTHWLTIHRNRHRSRLIDWTDEKKKKKTADNCVEIHFWD